MSEAMRIGSIIIFLLSKLWKAKFFILCDVIFLVRLQGNFEIDHSCEWKGQHSAHAANHLIGCMFFSNFDYVMWTVACPQALRFVFWESSARGKNWCEPSKDAGGGVWEGTRSSSPRALVSKPSGEPVNQCSNTWSTYAVPSPCL